MISVACLVVIRVFVFPIILLILDHKIKWFLLIFWVLSEKTDVDLLATIIGNSSQKVCTGFSTKNPKYQLKTTLFYAPVSLKLWGKPLLTPNKLGTTQVGTRGFGWGVKITENTKPPRGTLWECGVLGSEHRLYNHENYLNWGLCPSPLFRWRLGPPHPPFS